MNVLYRALLLLIIFSMVLPLPAKEAPWRKLQSEHFEILTQDSEKNARKVLEHLERVRAAYQVLTNSKIERPGRGRVVLFRNKAEYAPYAMSGLSDAYYLNARSRDYIVLNDFQSGSDRVLNHEYFHLFSKHADFQLPMWLEEGLADYFSTLKISDKDISVGLPVEGHLRFLNAFAGRLMPLAQIFAITRSTRHSADRKSTVQLYAQGWALAHMTFLSKDMMSRSGEFFQGVREGRNPEEVYQQVYGIDVQSLDRLLAGYVQRQSYQYYKHAVSGLDTKAPIQAVAVQDWEAPLLLASLQHYVRRGDDAAAAYKDLAAQFPSVPEIAEAQGYLALMEMDRETAAKHFRTAAANGSSNPALYYDLAMVGCPYTQFDEQCQKWINEALRLDPQNRDARKWAVGYVLNARKFDHALAYLARAGKVSAADAPEYFFQYAYAQANLQRFQEARSAIRRGLEFATTPNDISRLHQISKLVDSAEVYNQQVAQLRVKNPQPAPDMPPRQTQSAQVPQPENRPRIVRGAARAGVLPAISKKQQLIERFASEEDSVIASATLQGIECGDVPTYLVVISGKTLRLAVDNPGNVRVFRGSEPTDNHDFECGPQPGLPLLVGYQGNGAPKGADGILRILSFE